MNFRILGPLEVNDDAGHAIEIAGRQQRLVLAMLLVHRKRGRAPPPPLARCGESSRRRTPSRTSRFTRRACARHSRRSGARPTHLAAVFVHTRAEPARLGGSPASWTSTGSSSWSRRADARSQPASQEQAEADLRDALSVGRGPPLADFAYDGFAQGEIARLEGASTRRSRGADRSRACAEGGPADVTARPTSSSPTTRSGSAGAQTRHACALSRRTEGRRPSRSTTRRAGCSPRKLGLEPSESLRPLHSAVSDYLTLAAPARVPPTSDTTEPPSLDAAAVHPSQQDVARHRRCLAARLRRSWWRFSLDTRSNLCRDPSQPGPNSLVAIDPKTNRVVAEIRLAPDRRASPSLEGTSGLRISTTTRVLASTRGSPPSANRSQTAP